MSDQPTSVKFKYLFADDYIPSYVNGAIGGITPQGEIVINFYLERFPLPNTEIFEVTEEGKLAEKKSVDPEDYARSLVRQVTHGVVLNLKTARQVHEWLRQQIEAAEMGGAPIGDQTEE